MALHLGAPLGSAALQGTRVPLSSPSPAPSNGRARPRVSCQATFGAPKPAGQRVREQSPSKVQALAAPAVERELLLPAQPSPPAQQPAHTSSNILEVRRSELELQRSELERLLHHEAAPAFEEAEQQQQEEQQQQPQRGDATAAEAQERQQRSAAVSTTGQGQLQQQRRARLVTSTRHSRGAAASAAASAASVTTRDTAALQASVASRTAATSAALTSWLLDCRSRRERRAVQPLAPQSRRAASAAAQPRARGGAAAPAVQLEPGALQGLSQDTQEDMVVLINTRATLRCGRRTRRGSGKVSRSSGSDIMSTYMRNLGNTAVLSRQQEAALAGILQRGIQLQALAERLAAERGCDVAAVDAAALAAAAGLPSAADVAQRLANQREAKDLLMQYNVRLVINIAKRYVGNGIDIVDLIPEGLVGLSKSLDRFDASKGFKFSTYAHWWIRQSISRAVCDQARVVRLPSHVCETLYRINRAITSMTEQSERDEMPSYEEIAAAVDLPVRRVIHYLRLSKLPGGAASARDRPTQYLSGSSLKEVTYEALEDCAEDEDPGEEGEEEEAQHESIRQMTDLLLSTLEKRERNILRLRYGLLGWGPAAGGLSWDDNVDGGSMSLGEVASAYGLSKERIRQIEDKAMRALRKPWRQQLAQEIKFGEPISPSNLSHLASAQQMATEEGSWP